MSRRIAAISIAGVAALAAGGLYAGTLSTNTIGSLGAGTADTQSSCTDQATISPGAASWDSGLEKFAYTSVDVTNVDASCAYNEATATVYNQSTDAVLSTVGNAHVITLAEATAGSFEIPLATPVDASLTPADIRIGLLLESSVTHDAVSGVSMTGLYRSLDVSWVAPEDDGGVAPDGYKVEYALDNGGSAGAYTTYVLDTNSTSTTQLIYGLDPGAQYWVRITAWNSHGLSDASTEAEAPVGVVPYTNATAPTPVTASTGASAGQINANWTTPSSDGYSTITGYRVQTKTEGSSTWITRISTTGSTATSTVISGLTPGTNYYVRVAAINSAPDFYLTYGSKATLTQAKTS